MALWLDPFGKGREQKVDKSRKIRSGESGNFFITTA